MVLPPGAATFILNDSSDPSRHTIDKFIEIILGYLSPFFVKSGQHILGGSGRMRLM
jgi:hypothetical protein